jgi:hypothetical protein
MYEVGQIYVWVNIMILNIDLLQNVKIIFDYNVHYMT